MFTHTKYRPHPGQDKPDRRWPTKRITKAPLWCAVDLRDGNQALIEPMSVEQKKTMFRLLVKIGFKHIEIGFPSASLPDFEFTRWLIEEQQIPADVTVQALVQARDALIERTFEALDGVQRAIVHVYNSTSPVQRNKVFNLDKDGIKQIAINGAQKVKDEAAKYPDSEWIFQYSPESFSSTETEYAIEVCNAVLDVWQPTPRHKSIINLPATIECAGPNIFADQVETFCDAINYRDAILISLHTHNDRGCAIAAAELGLLAGADRIEGTLMGNGERTGNMDLVTMAMNMYSQGIDPELDLSNANEIALTVEQCTKIKTHPRHPWFGELVYTAFSGSHQDAIKKCLALQRDDEVWDVAYLPINPEDLGRNYQSVIRVNSQSGKGGVAYILETEHGIRAPRWLQIALSQQVQRYAEENSCEVLSDVIWDIFNQKFMRQDPKQTFTLQNYSLNKSQDKQKISTNLLYDGKEYQLNGEGVGTVAAFCDALYETFGMRIKIQNYAQNSLTKGTKSDAIAFVQAKIDDHVIIGASINHDTVSANMGAILVCVSKYIGKHNKKPIKCAS